MAAGGKYNERTMRRMLPMISALMLAGCQCALAQSETVILTHKFSVNQTVRYKIVQHIAGSRTFPGSSRSVPVEADVSSIIRVRCDQVSSDGTATIAIQIESGSLKIGKRDAGAFSSGSKPRTLQVTPGGKVIFPQQEEQVGDSITRRVLMDFGAVEPLIILASLPEQAVAVGGSWSADVNLPSATAVKVTSTLQEVKDVPGGRRAVIKQIQTSPENSQDKQEAQSTLVFGIDDGRLFAAEGTIHSVNPWALNSKYKVEMLKPS